MVLFERRRVPSQTGQIGQGHKWMVALFPDLSPRKEIVQSFNILPPMRSFFLKLCPYFVIRYFLDGLRQIEARVQRFQSCRCEICHFELPSCNEIIKRLCLSGS